MIANFRNNNSLEIADFDGTGTQQALVGGKHSISLYDLQNSGNLQMVLGTSVGMLVAR